MRRPSLCLVFVLASSACGAPASAPAPSVAPEAVPAQPVAAPAPSTTVPPTAPAPVAPVDLLHAVATDVAVSSAYHDQASQADHLVDGDLATAWNSRTDDLVGAWIDVCVPADAEVTSLELTPGFVSSNEARDLFTSNHRVARVRVLREGVELGVFSLDTSVHDLVSVPVSGPGGTYRIEVAEVLPGSRTDWRETCVSELRVMGRAPEMTPGARLPHTAVGALPPPRSLVTERVAIDAAHARDTAWLVTSWSALQRAIDDQDQNTGEPDPDAITRHDLSSRRDAMLVRIAALVEPLDAARADALRLEAIRAIDWTVAAQRTEAYARALDRIGEALETVATFLDTDEARCRSARTHAGIRLRRIASASHLSEYFSEIGESEGFELTGDALRRSRQVEHDDRDFQRDVDGWAHDTRAVAARLAHHTAPAAEGLDHDWTVLQAQLAVATAACGWQAP